MTASFWKSRAASSARPARSTASTAAMSVQGMCRSCLRMPPPVPVRRRWSTRARSARSFRPSPNSAAADRRARWVEDAAGVAGLHARRHEAELRLKAAETNLTRVEDVIGQLAGQIDGLKKQVRQAIRYREVAAKVRKAEAMLFHLRWLEANSDVTEAGHTHDLAVREMAERTREQAEAARIQAGRASELPALREAEARAAAGLQRLTNARELLDREEERARERVAELDRRLTQFSADIAREQQQTSDAEVALQRLDAEDSELKDEIKSRVEKRRGVDGRVSEGETTLPP